MIADIKPYAQYKESGFSWLGRVPAHWDSSPLAGLARLKAVVNQPERQLLSVYLQRGVVRFSDVEEKRTNATSEDLRKYQAVDPGNFVLNNQQAWRGSVGVSEYSGIISPAYLVLALSRRYLSRYANLLFRDQSMVSRYVVCSKGVGTIQRNLYWPHLKRVGSVVPPLDEQAAIVRFLDWANGRLERTIRAKRKVIALLGEQKQAIIRRAVTRGLDPSVPLKPSGIPWLGDIPQHWEVRRLKFVASRIVDCLHATPRYLEAGSYPAIRTADISPGVVDVVRAKRISTAEYVRWTERLEPREGDILYSREGERFGIAACVPPRVRLCISQRMMVFRIGARDNSTFVMRVLNSQSTYGQALQDVMGATAPHVNISTIRNYFLAMPRIEEQEAIVAYVDSQTGPINTAISRLEREMELLREYRTRLVADVVTGKLDVREAASRLPDDAPIEAIEDDADLNDEPEAEDEESPV